MDLYFRQHASLSAGCVIKPKGNISSFFGFERIGLEPLKVNFKNIGPMFSQAPNNPQNSVHLPSLKAGDTRGKEWPLCSSWPTQAQQSSQAGLCLLASSACWGDVTLSKLLLTPILGVSPGNCWKLAPPPHYARRSCGAHHSFSSATYGAGIWSRKKVHENWFPTWKRWNYILNLSLKYL